MIVLMELDAVIRMRYEIKSKANISNFLHITWRGYQCVYVFVSEIA